MFQVKEHVISAQHIRQYPRATRAKQEEELRLAVKQYIPLTSNKDQPGAVTIIGAHANGFPKELYEPLWEEIGRRANAAGFAIRAIWIADIASQGESGVLNDGKLGNDPSWFDHPRDLLHMINHFRDEMPRPLIGIGHSVGGAHLVNLALIHPRLLESVILLDPVIQRFVSAYGSYAPATMSSVRRDLWPSREAARTAFSRSKFYQAWDPRVLDLFIKHGLRELPTEVYPVPQPAATPAPATTEPTITPPPMELDQTRQVTLTTSRHQEVFLYLRPCFERGEAASGGDTNTEAARLTHPDFDLGEQSPSAFYRPEPFATFNNLPFLRPSALYIFGETSDLSTPPLIADKLAVTGVGVGGSGGAANGRVKHVTFTGTGHLVAMEKVTETADACAQWIGAEMERWRKNEAWMEARWIQTPDRDKYMLSKRHMEALKTEAEKQIQMADTRAGQSSTKPKGKL